MMEDFYHKLAYCIDNYSFDTEDAYKYHENIVKEILPKIGNIISKGYNNAVTVELDEARPYVKEFMLRKNFMGKHFNEVKRAALKSPLNRILDLAMEYAEISNRDITTEIHEIEKSFYR